MGGLGPALLRCGALTVCFQDRACACMCVHQHACVRVYTRASSPSPGAGLGSLGTRWLLGTRSGGSGRGRGGGKVALAGVGLPRAPRIQALASLERAGRAWWHSPPHSRGPGERAVRASWTDPRPQVCSLPPGRPSSTQPKPGLHGPSSKKPPLTGPGSQALPLPAGSPSLPHPSQGPCRVCVGVPGPVTVLAYCVTRDMERRPTGGRPCG